MSENGKLATVQELFGTKPKRRYKTLTLPASGLTVRIQSLTDRELSKYQSEVLASGGRGGITYRRSRIEDSGRRLIILCLVDEDGNRICNETHLQMLEEWDGADTNFLNDECSKHCGISREEIEDLVKKSEAIPASDSATDSPIE